MDRDNTNNLDLNGIQNFRKNSSDTNDKDDIVPAHIAKTANESLEKVSKNTGLSNNSYNAHVKDLFDDTKEIIDSSASSKIQIRWDIFRSFKHYFYSITVVIMLAIFYPYLNVYIKSILIGGLFANLVGLFAIIFRYAFSSSKGKYTNLISILLKWQLKYYQQKYKKNNK